MGAGAEWPFVATIADGETETFRALRSRPVAIDQCVMTVIMSSRSAPGA
jgi:hypothetical protein